MDHEPDPNTGTFRTGGNWEVTVVRDPERGENTGELWATAQRPEWADQIVEALNARDLLLWLHAEAKWGWDVVAGICERMETQHVTFFVKDTGEEIHPDWCRECRVDKLRAELDALKVDAVMLPDDAPELIERTLTNYSSPPPARVAALDLTRLLESWRGQPVTEVATEQAGP